ncbi:endo-1,4-beta-xylanase, partial [candidate division KSB1 bacterium]|nr:endo-1,4-beta-xylanase [candidate division KSB1 bacterium]
AGKSPVLGIENEARLDGKAGNGAADTDRAIYKDRWQTIEILSGETPVYVEAESGILGSGYSVQQDGDITYVTPTSNFDGQSSPEDPNRVITYQVTFQDTGYYDLFVRLYVGPGTYKNDSFFLARGFGEKNCTAGTDWVYINALMRAGFTDSADLVYDRGLAGWEVWKWVKLGENFFKPASPQEFYYVGIDGLSKSFQIGSREEGLFIDKFAFGKSDLYFTVDALDNELPGLTTKPEPDSSMFYEGPPLAEGSSKFLGNVKGSRDFNFDDYWNQLTPGNEGKWGSVATSPDSSRWNWGGLDALYKYAKGHNLIFRNHTLIWGNQQPSWIESLDTDKQLLYLNTWFKRIGQRYPEMDMTDVVNEPLHDPPSGATNGNYIQALGGKGETGWDWVINSFKMARKYLPNTKLVLNDYGIINDNSATTSYLKIIGLLQDRGLIDGIGVQGHRFELESANVNTLKNNLDKLAATGLPIYITEMDLGNLRNEGTPNDDVQLRLYQRIFPILWEHPGVEGITLWGYLEGQMWQSTCYLVHTDGTLRPAMEWLIQYIKDNLTGVEKTVNTLPSEFKLEQNYPNPFNPTTKIEFSIPESAKTSLKIYDILGREVATLVNKNLTAGVYNITWDAKNSDGSQIVSGTYFYRLAAGNFLITQKMIFLK